MASATARTEIVTKTVTLVLSGEEAEALDEYLDYCGNDPCTYRLQNKHLYGIQNVIQDALDGTVTESPM